MQWTELEKTAWISALECGEVTIAPAEGVYGYCADPFNESALTKLNDLKKRDQNKGFIVLVRDILQLSHICKPFDQETLQELHSHWDDEKNGPITMILPAAKNLPKLLTGGKGTVAVRLPHTPYMQEYLAFWGRPLVSTSLNITGEEPAVEVVEEPVGIASLTLQKPLPGTVSKIYDVTTKKWLR